VDQTLARHAVEHAVRWNVFEITFCSAIFALVVAYGVSRSLANRVSRLKRFAVGLVEVRPSESYADDSHDELGALEHTLTRVAAEIGKLLDRLRFESARREAILSSMGEGVLAVDSELRRHFLQSGVSSRGGSRRVLPPEPITPSRVGAGSGIAGSPGRCSEERPAEDGEAKGFSSPRPDV